MWIRSRSRSSTAGEPARTAASRRGHPACLENGRIGQPRIAGRPGDASPVGVAAVDRRLDEARGDDRASDGPGARVVCGAGHARGDERRRALAVGGLLAGEVAGDCLDRGAQRRGRRAPGRDLGGARRPGCQDEDGVVRARVAVDRELVPGSDGGGSEKAPQDSRARRRHRSGRPTASSPSAGGSSRPPWRCR